MQDIGELKWVRGVIRSADKVVMFMRNHQFTQALVRTYTTKELLKPGNTRFGTNLLMIERLIELKAGLQVGRHAKGIV